MKRIAILLAFLASSVTVMFAQNLSVKGTVYDFDTADPLFPAAAKADGRQNPRISRCLSNNTQTIKHSSNVLTSPQSRRRGQDAPSVASCP